MVKDTQGRKIFTQTQFYYQSHKGDHNSTSVWGKQNLNFAKEKILKTNRQHELKSSILERIPPSDQWRATPTLLHSEHGTILRASILMEIHHHRCPQVEEM